jgi:hypothetical protein
MPASRAQLVVPSARLPLRSERAGSFRRSYPGNWTRKQSSPNACRTARVFAMPRSSSPRTARSAQPSGQLRIALRSLGDQHLIAIAEGEGCGYRPTRGQRNRHSVTLFRGLFGAIAFQPESSGGSALGGVSAERDSCRLVAEPPRETRHDAAALSFPSNRTTRCFGSLHRHQLPTLFGFADGLFADREWLLGCPFSDVPADDRLRTSSKASSGVWTDPRIAFSAPSSERAN